MGEIKINFGRVFDQGDKYSKSSENLNALQKELIDIEEQIKEAWPGDEKADFLNSFEDQVIYLDEFKGFLDGKGELLKKVSGFHEDSEKEFINQMERSELQNERRD